jgi:hypothetical protein
MEHGDWKEWTTGRQGEGETRRLRDGEIVALYLVEAEGNRSFKTEN